MTESRDRSLQEALSMALNQAGIALSQFVFQNVSLNEFSMQQYPIQSLPSLFGAESTPVAAAFFGVKGDLRGYLLLMIPLEEIDSLMATLLGDDALKSELVDSALGELGNIVGSAFLNCLADVYRLQALPTPPQVVFDMAGALLGSLAGSLAAEGVEQAPVIQTQWVGEKHELRSYLVWLPEAEQLKRLGAF